MAGFGNFGFIDHDGERSNTGFWTGAITAVSLPGALTQFGALRTAIAGITLGTLSSESLKVFETKLGNEKAANPQAQRETKWLVSYEDATEFFDPPINAIPNAGYRRVFNIEIPTADLSLLLPNTDLMDITGGAGAAFVTAFEQLARSPYGGAVNVLEVRHVGRNL